MKSVMHRRAKCDILLATGQVGLWLAVRERSAISCSQLNRAQFCKSTTTIASFQRIVS